MKIEYIKGDATSPAKKGNKIIVHICNDIGGWGKGFVTALSAKWKQPEQEYRNWFTSKENFELGKVQFVNVENNMWVANIIGQRGIKNNDDNEPPIRYEAVSAGLSIVADRSLEYQASIHMPRIGCGLAGGSWDKIEPIIISQLIDKGISVTVYDL